MKTSFQLTNLKGLAFIVLAVFILVASVIDFRNDAAGTEALSFQTVRDCNSSAIINCGALNTNQLISEYTSNQYAQKVYKYSGIATSSMHKIMSTAVAGIVDTNGNVYVKNQSTPVALNVVTASRRYSSGSKSITSDGIHFFDSTAGQNFTGTSADAYVVMMNHHFKFAIIASSGDPVVLKTVRTTQLAAVSTVMKPVPSTTLANTGPFTAVSIAELAATIIIATLSYYALQLRRLNRE